MKVIGPFFFLENNVSRYVYVDMLVNYAVHQLQDIKDTIVIQQDGAYPH